MKKITVCIMLVLSFSLCNGQGKILIAAASDLRFAMDSVIGIFERAHGGTVDITYGSSGKLTEQILNGAPFHLLLSADISYPEILEKANHTGSAIFPYARGRIVLWSKKLDVRGTGMKSLLDPSVGRIAIANPRHAPYGKRAIESLEHYGILAKVKTKLVYGENVSQTAQFVTAGAADIAIVALSLALSPNVRRENGNYFIIPEYSHSPLIQGAVVTRYGMKNELARQFLDFLKAPQAIVILEHYGFTIP